MDKIPSEIKDKIFKESRSIWHMETFESKACRGAFNSGAIYGYQLASKTIDELQKKVNDLTPLLKRIKQLEFDEAFDKNEIESLQKRISELAAENNRLKMDNMTHEYNQAEAEKFAPEYKRQIEEPLLAEIERLKGLAWRLFSGESMPDKDEDFAAKYNLYIKQ